MNSNGKVALVTGGGSGIGKASALALAREGFAVVVAGRRPEPLQAVVGEIESMQGKGLGVPTDVGDPDSVKALFAKAKATYGRLDVLFNNAGFGAAAPIEELAFERWQAVVSSILTGSFLCTQEAFKIMKEQTPMGGRIINNGSISAHVPRPNSVAYTSCKHAITGLTKSTSLDGRKYDISCGQIDVGNALTEMTQRMQRGVQQANGTVIEEPTMDVANVARAIVFMSHRDARGQRPVPDRDGDQDAVCRPRLVPKPGGRAGRSRDQRGPRSVIVGRYCMAVCGDIARRAKLPPPTEEPNCQFGTPMDLQVGLGSRHQLIGVAEPGRGAVGLHREAVGSGREIAIVGGAGGTRRDRRPVGVDHRVGGLDITARRVCLAQDPHPRHVRGERLSLRRRGWPGRWRGAAGQAPTATGRAMSGVERRRLRMIILPGSAASLSLSERRGDVAAIDGGDVGGGLERQRLMQEGLGHVLGRDLAAEQIAGHVVVLAEAARLGAAGDHRRGQEPAADAVGVDRVGADAVGAVIERVLPHQRQGRGLGQAVGTEIRAGVDRLLRHVEQQTRRRCRCASMIRTAFCATC